MVVFLSRVFIRGRGGAGGRGLICLCPSPRSRSGEEGTRGSIVNYHNWSIPRVSSSRKWTGQGLSTSKQEHFFAPKSSSKRSFFFFFFKVLRTDDIGAPEDVSFFPLLLNSFVLRDKKWKFFCMIKCCPFLIIGLFAR